MACREFRKGVDEMIIGLGAYGSAPLNEFNVQEKVYFSAAINANLMCAEACDRELWGIFGCSPETS